MCSDINPILGARSMNKDGVNTQDSELTLSQLIYQSHQTALEKGWWEDCLCNGVRLGVMIDKDKVNVGEKIALMHSELSEGLEGDRKDLMSDKIPDFSMLEEELADVLIRIGDFSAAMQLRLVEAVKAKLEFNKSREYKHGGKKY